MSKPRSWHSQTSILHTSVLYVSRVATTLAGWSKTQTSNLGGKREREGQIVASLCVAILHLHCQKLPLVSKYNYGWKVQDNTLAVDWDSDVNMDAVKERVEGLLKGCRCKTGCQTRQCRCKAKEKGCGEGCNCTNCTNTHLPTPNVTGSMEEMSVEEIIEDAPPKDLDEIMEWVFGDNETGSQWNRE